MPTTIWTILKLIRWTEQRFKKEGISSSRLEAEVLLGEALSLDRVELYTHFDQPLEPAELQRFKEMVKRRLKREPLPYIVGKKEFWSMPFKVTPHVLIPRPETEILVEEALRLASAEGASRDPFNILEIGTGSGAIVIALAKELPAASLVATEISASALNIAQENALTHGVANRIKFIERDLFPPSEPIYDLILTNPPYISWDQISTLPPEVRDFEPRLAWDGGKDGLEFFRRILPRVSEFLCPGGWLLMEIGAGQAEAVKNMARGNADLETSVFVSDLAGIERVFKARKKKIKELSGGKDSY